jgi:cytosine/adenosine deaminase-related metal-dependent hydrolase
VLGRDDLGSLEPRKRADLAIWDVSGIEAAGSWDPVAALVLCGPTRVRNLIVEGRQVVRDGQMVTLDLPRLIERQNRLAQALVR